MRSASDARSSLQSGCGAAPSEPMNPCAKQVQGERSQAFVRGVRRSSFLIAKFALETSMKLLRVIKTAVLERIDMYSGYNAPLSQMITQRIGGALSELGVIVIRRAMPVHRAPPGLFIRGGNDACVLDKKDVPEVFFYLVKKLK